VAAEQNNKGLIIPYFGEAEEQRNSLMGFVNNCHSSFAHWNSLRTEAIESPAWLFA
jgi:hypothetical protein